MSHYGEQTSAEVAAEAEHERADLAHTLDQLRERLQPRNVVDEVMSHAKANSAGVSDRLWDVARANPVAAALIGIGAAMMFGVGRAVVAKSSSDRTGWGAYDRLPSSAVPDPRLNPDDRRDVPGDYRTATLRDTARDLNVRRFPDKRFQPSSPSKTVGPSMNSLSAIRHPTASLSRLFEEQPLILAALGVAVGAAVGSALPPTDLESQWMGDASENVRQNASAAARQQLAQLKTAAGQTLDQMKTTAAEHGVSSDNLSGLVRDLGDDVRSASQALGENARDA